MCAHKVIIPICYTKALIYLGIDVLNMICPEPYVLSILYTKT